MPREFDSGVQTGIRLGVGNLVACVMGCDQTLDNSERGGRDTVGEGGWVGVAHGADRELVSYNWAVTGYIKPVRSLVERDQTWRKHG